MESKLLTACFRIFKSNNFYTANAHTEARQSNRSVDSLASKPKPIKNLCSVYIGLNSESEIVIFNLMEFI